MRWMVPLALGILFLATPLWAQDQPANPTSKRGGMQRAVPEAQPDNPRAYAQPTPRERDERQADDFGPVLKHFIRASETDDLMETQVQDNAAQDTHEKIVLDKKIKVPLVHDVQNDSTYSAGGNAALDFELKYLNWGAVTASQLQARQGHYFTITWDNDGPVGDFTARFEYRQVKSQEVVRTLSQKMTKVTGATRSYFAVVDKAYLAYGPVSSWRFTILKGDTIVAQAKSFIW